MLSQKPWRAEAVIQLVAGVFACLGVGVVAAGVLRQAGVAAFQSPDSSANILLATLSFQGAAWFLIFFLETARRRLARRVWPPQREPEKIPAARRRRAGLVLPVVLGLEQFSVLALEKLGWPPEDQRAVELIVNAKSVVAARLSRFFRDGARAGGGGIHFSRRAVSVRQAARLAEARRGSA